MTKGQAREDIYESPDHNNVKLTYTRFPKHWTAEQIYEYLISRAGYAPSPSSEASLTGSDPVLRSSASGGGHFLDEPGAV